MRHARSLYTAVIEQSAVGNVLLARRSLQALLSSPEQAGAGSPVLASQASAWLALSLSLRSWEQAAASTALHRTGGRAFPALRQLLRRDRCSLPEPEAEASWGELLPTRCFLPPAALLRDLFAWAAQAGAASSPPASAAAVLAATPDAAAAAEGLLQALAPRLALIGPALGRTAAFTSASASRRLPDSQVTLLGGRQLEDVKARRMAGRVRRLRAEQVAEHQAGAALLLGAEGSSQAELPATLGRSRRQPTALLPLHSKAYHQALPTLLAYRMRRREAFQALPLFERAAVLRVESAELERAASAPLLAALSELFQQQQQAQQVQQVQQASTAALAAQQHLWARLHSRALALAVGSGGTGTLSSITQACSAQGAPLTSQGLQALVSAAARAAGAAEASRLAGSAASAALVSSPSPRQSRRQRSGRGGGASVSVSGKAGLPPLLTPGSGLTSTQWKELLSSMAALVLPPQQQLASFLLERGGQVEEAPAPAAAADTSSAPLPLQQALHTLPATELWGALHRLYTPLISAAGASGDLQLAFQHLDTLRSSLAQLQAAAALPAHRCAVSPQALIALATACCASGQPRRAQQLLQPLLAAVASSAPAAAAAAGSPPPAHSQALWEARQALTKCLAAHGRLDAALELLGVLQAEEGAGRGGGAAVSASTYAALCGSLALGGDGAGALTLLRCAQLAGALRHWDLGLGAGVLMSGGLPVECLAVLLPDALRCLRGAVLAGAVGLPRGGLRIYHAPCQRTPLRGLLAAAGLSASSQGRSTGVRHLLVSSEELRRVLLGERRGERAAAAGQAGQAGQAAPVSPQVAALLQAHRPLGGGLGSRAPGYSLASLACLAHSSVPPSASHFHASMAARG